MEGGGRTPQKPVAKTSRAGYDRHNAKKPRTGTPAPERPCPKRPSHTRQGHQEATYTRKHTRESRPTCDSTQARAKGPIAPPSQQNFCPFSTRPRCSLACKKISPMEDCGISLRPGSRWGMLSVPNHKTHNAPKRPIGGHVALGRATSGQGEPQTPGCAWNSPSASMGS